MNLLRSFLLFGALIALVSSAGAAPGLKNGKKKKHDTVHGTVVAVHRKSAHTGSITIKPHQHHKKASHPKAGMKAAVGKGKGKAPAVAAQPKAAVGQPKAAAGQPKGGAGQAAVGKPPAGQPKGAAANQPKGAAQGEANRANAGMHHHHLKTYHVTSQTHFDAEIRTGGMTHHLPASFMAVQPGQHVAIHAQGHTAKQVTILHHMKKKKSSSGRPGTRKKNK